jgi:hypothetical protein
MLGAKDSLVLVKEEWEGETKATHGNFKILLTSTLWNSKV